MLFTIISYKISRFGGITSLLWEKKSPAKQLVCQIIDLSMHSIAITCTDARQKSFTKTNITLTITF